LRCCWLLAAFRAQVRIVEHAFDIIHLLTDQNPIQIVVDAIINRCARGWALQFAVVW
jgi:hypothetical protein